ncbi:uncharacterized protein MELLADRAFT_102854 [Melampsora larici-populina 98AG31]|uniref:Uncharacterized protein n=1 Tax=Melampsora larici-populina (strain 98AG31 / pathotype 3-4-7) TaxID=747676 RepID=F4R9L8_MELLP|nr:uncharacterized protein MELLADRAFT_102854 [Melampsora larici-populina 98AG31]EGG11002.1 hypothetical protein MELLADRAFT_102854 [Melampsora larici-populina 98AG31]
MESRAPGGSQLTPKERENKKPTQSGEMEKEDVETQEGVGEKSQEAEGMVEDRKEGSNEGGKESSSSEELTKEDIQKAIQKKNKKKNRGRGKGKEKKEGSSEESGSENGWLGEIAKDYGRLVEKDQRPIDAQAKKKERRGMLDGRPLLDRLAEVIEFGNEEDFIELRREMKSKKNEEREEEGREKGGRKEEEDREKRKGSSSKKKRTRRGKRGGSSSSSSEDEKPDSTKEKKVSKRSKLEDSSSGESSDSESDSSRAGRTKKERPIVFSFKPVAAYDLPDLPPQWEKNFRRMKYYVPLSVFTASYIDEYKSTSKSNLGRLNAEEKGGWKGRGQRGGNRGHYVKPETSMPFKPQGQFQKRGAGKDWVTLGQQHASNQASGSGKGGRKYGKGEGKADC